MHICEAADMFIRRALEDEVLETYKIELEKEGKDNESIKETMEEVKKRKLTRFVGLDVAYNMGWQKRLSG